MVSLMVTNANIHSSHLTQQSSATHCTFYFHFISFVQPIRVTSVVIPVWPVLALPYPDQIYQSIFYSSLVSFQAQLTLFLSFFNEIFIFILKKWKQIPLNVFNIRALKSCVTVSSVWRLVRLSVPSSWRVEERRGEDHWLAHDSSPPPHYPASTLQTAVNTELCPAHSLLLVLLPE